MIRKALAILTIAGLVPLAAAEVSFKDNSVTGTGHASVLMLADVAIIGMTVEITATEMAGITAKATEAVSKLGAELVKAGVSKPLIYNGSGTLFGQINYDSQRLEYKHTFNVACALDNLSLVDKVLAIIESETGDSPAKISVTEINYTLKDIKPYIAELREKALKEARAEAEETARAYGKSVGELVTAIETSYTANYLTYNPPYTFDFNAEDMDSKSTLPRTTVGIDVVATYELK